MQKEGNAGGRTPKAAIRALVDKFAPNTDAAGRIRSVSGKVLPVAVAGGALVMVGQPLVAGAGPEPAPAAHHVQAAAHTVQEPVTPLAQASPALPPMLAPAPAAPLAPAAPPAPAVPPAPAAPAPAPQAAPKPVSMSVPVDYQAQQTSYWCGPTAARIALSSKTDKLPEQGILANELGTTENGTDTIGQVADGLNRQLAGSGVHYEARDLSQRPLTPEVTEQLWADTVRNISEGKAMVANIVAKPGNQPPGYPSSQTIYHYVAVVGYNAENKTVHISDPARFSGIEDYWISVDQLASLVQSKGYTA